MSSLRNCAPFGLLMALVLLGACIDDPDSFSVDPDHVNDAGTDDAEGVADVEAEDVQPGADVEPDAVDREADCEENAEYCPTPAGGACVFLDEDRYHCGSCGNRCDDAPSYSDARCVEGACTFVCHDGFEECGEQCVNLQDNPDHCGDCGQTCADDEFCDQGTCAEECSPGLVGCQGSCVDIWTNAEHCGGCGEVCGDYQHCVGGICEDLGPDWCPEETPDLCGDDCVDLSSNPDHCGECANYCLGDCIDGVCEDFGCDDQTALLDQGSGTAGDPHPICTAEHLSQIPPDSDAYFVVTTDIDMAEFLSDNDFQPIEDFGGALYGDGHSIQNLVIDGENRTGLFARIMEGARVENLKLHDVEVTGGDDTGALAGISRGQIRHVEVSGTVYAQGDNTGGLVGRNLHTIATSHSSATVHVDQASRIGGLVGRNHSDSDLDCAVTASTATGVIQWVNGINEDSMGGLVGSHEDECAIAESSASASVAVAYVDRVGGLVGSMHDEATLTDSHATGETTGQREVGGLVGFADENTSIDTSSATGAVFSNTTHNDSHTGGFVGLLHGTVTNSQAHGNVYGRTWCTGGFAGRIEGGTVENSWASGTVTSPDGCLGGLAGNLGDGGELRDSYATGTVDGGVSVGGLLGSVTYGTVTDSHATGEVRGSNNVGGLVGRSWWEGGMHIVDSYATGDVTGYEFVGGLVGYMVDSGSRIRFSHATGDVLGVRGVGGLVGEMIDASQLHTSYATGDVTAVGSDYRIGGLVGHMRDDTEVHTSFAVGDVYAPDHGNVGGLVGRTRHDAEIFNSYATGNATGDARVGGLVGRNRGEVIQHSYSIGAPTDSSSTTGGLVGDSGWGGHSDNSYWNVDTSGQTEDRGGGQPRTTEEFGAQDNFEEWNFAESWQEGDEDTPWYLPETLDEVEGLIGDDSFLRPRLWFEFHDE